MPANGYHDEHGPPEYVDRSLSPEQVKQSLKDAAVAAIDLMLPGDELRVARLEQCCAHHPQWELVHTRPESTDEPPDGIEPYRP